MKRLPERRSTPAVEHAPRRPHMRRPLQVNMMVRMWLCVPTPDRTRVIRAPMAGRSTNSPLVTLRPDRLRVTLTSILCLWLASLLNLGLAHTAVAEVEVDAVEMGVVVVAFVKLLLTTPLTSCPAVDGVTTVPFRHMA